MAALNFPPNPTVGAQYTSDLGTTYIWDGVKWVGHSAGGAVGTNSIQNNGHTVQVRSDGALILSEGSVFADLAWTTPASLATNDVVVIPPQGGATNITGSGDNGGAQLFWSQWAEPVCAPVLQDGIPSMAFNWAFLNRDGFSVENYPAGNESTNYKWNFGNDGALKFPNVDTSGAQIAPVTGGISFGTDTGDVNIWPGNKQFKFDASGVLTLPAGGDIKDSTGTSVLSNRLPTDAAGYLINDGSGGLSWGAGDGTGSSVGNFTFASDTVNMPLEAKLNSGGIGVPNSAEIGTSVAFDGPDIGISEVFMGSGYGEFRSIYNKTSPLDSGLVYAGVEGFNYVNHGDVNFAGMVSQTPNIDSMYALRLNEQGQIVIGFTQNDQTQTSNDWSVVVGTLTTDYTVNGLFANTTTTVIGSGLSSWKFDNAGVLNLPNNNGQIGQLEAPYTGLEFRTGSGADWIGISYGEINDNNTSYFYFDKDGSNYTTANHRAHLQLKNAAHDGHVEWLFDVTGNLTLPPGGDILNSSGHSVLGGGGNANTGNFTFDADTISNDNGLLLATDRGTLAFGTNMEGPGVPGHFHIAFDGSNVIPPSNDLFLGDDYNYVKLPGNTITPYGVEIGTHNRDGGDSNNWRFETDGNLVLPQGSTISDQATSVDLTINRTSDNPYWYNLFGDTGATIDANATINGSVCHDSGGNVYSLGSVTHSVGFNTDNLFLKYSPEGNLLWRRTWTDNFGMDCGSLNASLRFIAANVELGTQDTIAWAGWVPTQNISYVGTMDTEGNMVDQFGDTRLATRLDLVRVTDLEWVGNVYGDGNSIVGVVGNYYLYDGSDHYQPFICAVDLDLGAIISNSTVVPAGSDSTKGGWYNRSWDNIFKAITIPPGNLIGAALVGTYHDGADSHAMIGAGGGGTVLYQIGQGTEDNIGEDICCDAYGNVYVIVNNTTSNYAVLSKVNLGALFATQDSVWQTQLGFDPITVGDRFYATAVAYDNGSVYVLGTYYNVEDDNTDTMLIKVGIGNGDVVWQRRIGTAVNEGPGGADVFGAPGWESSSGISIYDNLIAVTFSTEDNSVDELNTVTLQYPTDGSILGTFGDFTITDFSIGATSADYGITTLSATVANPSITSGFATLNPTVLTVGTGWTNTQWDLENNRQVYPAQTWKFNVDGTFDTPEITHLGEVRITAAVAPNVVEPTPSTWAFQNNDGLRFPDGSVQYGAYVETETALDGGSAVTVFNIIPRPLAADGGGSSSRHGVTDPVYDGSSGNDYVLDGGGA